MPDITDLYQTDFAEWAFRNAELLRSGRVSEADLDNIAEEIDSLGRSQSHELKSRLAQIMERMLQLRYTAEELRERNAPGWRGSIARQRTDIGCLLRDSPSLRRLLNATVLATCYADAAKVFTAAFELRAPAKFPFTLDEVVAE
jgi:hypothetical protein